MNPFVKQFIEEGENVLHELLDTRHYREISRAKKYMDDFERSQKCSDLKNAIEFFKKVNEDDRKYAQCKAFEDIALCYYMLSMKYFEKNNIVEAINCIDESIRYQSMILKLEATVFTRDFGKIETAKKNTPSMIEKFIEEKQRFKSAMGQGNNGINGKVAILMVLAVAAVAVLTALLVKVLSV